MLTPSESKKYDFKKLKKIENKVNDLMTTKLMSTTCILIIDWLKHHLNRIKKNHLKLGDLELFQKVISEYIIWPQTNNIG